MVAELELIPYEPQQRTAWDRFILGSKNGIFLFQRDYMDYHADRFQDASLMFTQGSGNVVAVFPASRRDDVVVSHGGLTFGGVISDQRMRTTLMVEVIDALTTHLRNEGCSQLIYKAIPHIYHRLPAEEDVYAIFARGARVFRRDLSSTILMSERLAFSKGRKWSIKLARSSGLEVRRSHDFATFMAIEEENLRARHEVKPVHTAAEMELLAGRFPDNVKLFSAFSGQEMLGGIVIYESAQVAHAQYLAATEAGRQCGATDLIVEFLLEHYAADGKRYFDFGISTDQDGTRLNAGLADNKEGFGARATVYDFYTLDLTNA